MSKCPNYLMDDGKNLAYDRSNIVASLQYEYTKWQLVYKNGDIYNGEINKDFPENFVWHGFGKIRYIDGTVYIGQYRNMSRIGVCELTLPDGVRYYGEAIVDEKLPSWTVTYPDGTKYQGLSRQTLHELQPSLIPAC